MIQKRSSLILLSVLIFLLLPFFVLTFFVHPSADDFGFAVVVKALGRWGFQDVMYRTWEGRYFSNFILSLNPLAFDSFVGYKLFSLFLSASFVGSVAYLVHVFFKEQFKGVSKAIVILLLTLLYLNIMPSSAETIYWMTGAIVYFIPTILTLIFLPLVVQGVNYKERKPWHAVVVCVLGCCICGSNEISFIFLLEILGLLILYHFKDRSALKFLLPVLVVLIISAAIDIIAPGNYVRMTNFSNAGNILYGLKESVVCSAKLFGIHFNSPAFIILSLLSLPVMSAIKNKGNTPIIHMNPWLAGLLLVFIFISLFFPVCYSTGLPSPMRIYNTTSVLFIISWFYVVYLFIHYYNLDLHIPKALQSLLFVSVVIFFMTGFNKEPGQPVSFSGNISRAFYDLMLNAPKYNNELNGRYEIIKAEKAAEKQDIRVPALSVIPSTIYFIDILPDSSHWINIGTAQYFGLNSIRLHPDSDTVKQ